MTRPQGRPEDWPIEPVDEACPISHDEPAVVEGQHRDHRDPGDRERLRDREPGWSHDQ